jgi:hypothetical protein
MAIFQMVKTWIACLLLISPSCNSSSFDPPHDQSSADYDHYLIVPFLLPSKTPAQPCPVSYVFGTGACDSCAACGSFICASLSIGTRAMPGGMPYAPVPVLATLLMGCLSCPCCCKAAAISEIYLTFSSLRRRFVSAQAHTNKIKWRMLVKKCAY